LENQPPSAVNCETLGRMQVDLDFETCNLAGLDLQKVGAARYTEDFWTEILSLVFCLDEGEKHLWLPGAGGLDVALIVLDCAASNPKVIFNSHSAFEQFVWMNIMVPRFGFPPIPISRWNDTQALCAYHSVPLALDGALTALALPVVKDAEGQRITLAMSPTAKNIKKWSYEKTHTPERMERVYSYNVIDVAGVSVIRTRLGPLPAAERAVWELDQTINQRGVGLDLSFVRAARTVAERASVPLVAEFRDLTGGLNPTQRDAVLAWCQGAVPNLQKATIETLLGDDDADEDGPVRLLPEDSAASAIPGNVRRALAIRATIGSASVKKLTAMEQCVCGDGRVRGLIQYHAALPGRFAGRLIQPQNFPRGSLGHLDPEVKVRAIMAGDPEQVKATLGCEPIEAVVSSLRHAFCARPGHAFVSGDYSGVEARLVLALAGQHDRCELLASGYPVYFDMAERVFGKPKGTWATMNKAQLKANKEAFAFEYHIGKNAELGCGFGLGGDTFCRKYCPDCKCRFTKGWCEFPETPGRNVAGRAVFAYREGAAPKVMDLHKDLEKTALKALWGTVDQWYEADCGIAYRLHDGWMQCRLLDGKLLHYWNPQPIRKDRFGRAKDGWQYTCWKGRLKKVVDAYGGILTQNVIEGLARQLLVHAMLKAEANKMPVAFHVTDEIITEPDERYGTEALITELMTKDLPRWVYEIRFPCAVETWIGSRYKK
jgi:DNA polymerase